MMKRDQPLLIVDGFNLLRSSGAYDFEGVEDYDDDPINRAREKLIADVAVYAQRRYEAVVVFDGGGNIYSDGSPADVAGISVVFSPAGTEADETIERLAYRARKAGREVVVISSDWDIQNATFGGGVTRMSAVGFAQEMESVREGYEEEATSHAKFTLGARLDPATRAKLDAILKRSS